MTEEAIAIIVEQSIVEPDLDKLKMKDSSYWKGQLKAAVNLVSGAAAEELQQYYDYKDDEFFRKFTAYLLEMKETTADERHKLADEIQQMADDYAGNVIFGMVDRLDSIRKQQIFARLSIARIHDMITIEDFFRLHSLLERIPYVDLKALQQYKEPFYDDSGDTELLFASGALELRTIDSKGGPNKYILSRLGESLLKWGLCVQLELEHGKGTNVELDTITAEDIDEIVGQKVEDARPKWEGDILDKVTAADSDIDEIFDRVDTLEDNQLSTEYDAENERLILKKGN